MKEYNFDINEINEENNMTEKNEFCTDGHNSPKPPRKRRGLKIAATLMAMVMVSAGSIAVYRQIEPSYQNGVTAVSEEVSEKDSARSLAAQSVSLIKTDDTAGTELSTEEIVEKLLPSVVGIESQFTVTSQSNSGYFFGFGGFENQMPSTSQATATGTGVVITENGYVVTNAHVIYDSEYGAGLADSISVLLNDDKSYDAEVVGYDTDCDLAVLKINADGLTAAEFGNSDELHLGESVIAIGNPLGFELMDTVTGGMISGLNRSITINDKAMTLIQTDAAINSGNSGGPLINKYGQVVGINSSKMSSSYSSGASIEGIGFAIPSNEVSAIVDDLMKYGYVTGKPQLGISCQDVTDTISNMYNIPVGIYVTNVADGGAAEKAGLQSGDVITAVDGETVKTSEELTAKKNLHKAGESVEITYIRNGRENTVKVVLDEVKSES
ncbi:MAG: trypsin-like peptidase domain-containing protein [Ruminococcus sp.]|nr:trypsin-like peptidase domain-containing protein [Ruminococcus sp.]